MNLLEVQTSAVREEWKRVNIVLSVCAVKKKPRNLPKGIGLCVNVEGSATLRVPSVGRIGLLLGG